MNEDEKNLKNIEEEVKEETKEESIKEEVKVEKENEEIVVLEEKKEEENKPEAELEIKSEIENKEESTEVITQETKKEKKKKGKVIISIVILIIVLIFISTIFAIININNDKIIKGTYIQGIDVSDLTEDEAIIKLKQKTEEIDKKDIIIKYKDYSTTITPEQIELKIDFNEAVKKAKQIGKTNNILIDNYSILKTNLLKTNIDSEISYNKEILINMLKNINAEIPGAIQEPSYEIVKDKLIITKGEDGISVKIEELEELIIKNIKNQLCDKVEEIEIPVENKEPKDINIEEIYKEVYKEPTNASIQEEPFKLNVEKNGLDFKITIDEAKELLKQDKEKYEIPLKITTPKIKTEDLGNKIFKQTLSKYTTIYDAGNRSRSTNIAIAARTLNGKIILPGETFSYNKTLGDRTKEKGYQLGGAYVGGKVVSAYGGGICQVSTTLYNAVLYANLGIVERYNHSYAVSYVPAGRDATVSYGGKDFKFKNTRKYPVKINASAKNGVINISLVGIKEEKEYDIEIRSSVLSTTPYSTVYQNNSSLAEGKQKVIQVGHTGLKSKAYKIVKYNGKIISNTLLSADTYQPMNRIIEKGTKKVKPSEKPAASKPQEKPSTSKPENKIEEADIIENED